eukprot:scaffold24175_cov125-Isochrysis_galbana.AAC.12
MRRRPGSPWPSAPAGREAARTRACRRACGAAYSRQCSTCPRARSARPAARRSWQVGCASCAACSKPQPARPRPGRAARAETRGIACRACSVAHSEWTLHWTSSAGAAKPAPAGEARASW